MSLPTLAELSENDRPRVGGKAANLVRLVAAGFPVPAGFVVPVECFRDHIGGALDEAALAAELTERAVAGERYAVRSSATLEDLEDASFAGQYETVLHVAAEDLFDAVRTCWASVRAPSAVAYRRELGIGDEEAEMAVLIQPMVDADVSGVTFTNDPLTADPNRIVTDAVAGLGQALVDGRASPERFVVNRGEPAASDSSLLDAAALQLITDWSLKSEALFGRPQDLEWSIAGEQLWILQSRAITNLEDDEAPITGKWVLFKPVYENFTHPVTPLTSELFNSLGGVSRTYMGRAYYRLGVVKRILPFDLTDEQAANAFYLISTDGLTWKNVKLVPVILTVVVISLLTLVFGHFRIRAGDLPDGFMREFPARAKRVAGDRRIGPLGVLYRLMLSPNIFAPIGQYPNVVNNDSVAYSGTLALLGWLLKRWLPDLDPAANERLCAGNEGVLPVEMGREIWQLAQNARTSDVVVRALEEGSVEGLRDVPEAQEFMREFDALLLKHGHRAASELEIATPRWNEDPSPVVTMIRGHLRSSRDLQEDQRQNAELRMSLLGEVRAGLSGWRLRLVEALIDKTRYLAKLRENSRFYHVMVFGAMRTRALGIGQELVNMGKLAKVDDVFFLLEAEMFEALDGDLGRDGINALLRRRRLKHLRDSKRIPPRFLGFGGESFSHSTNTSEEHADGEVLKGQGASPGACEGTARVIMNPEQGLALEEGEILIAPYTDPAWTPLFLRAGAAVVEVGSFLSHAGTIAREYGMPCVVDVDDCMRHIKTGDRLRVDGTTGTVTRL